MSHKFDDWKLAIHVGWMSLRGDNGVRRQSPWSKVTQLGTLIIKATKWSYRRHGSSITQSPPSSDNEV